MKTVLFRNKADSYQLTMLLGILSGIFCIFIGKWTVQDTFLSGTCMSLMPVWLLVCSLIALFSEKNLVAGLHSAIYTMFLVVVPIVKDGINRISDGGLIDCLNVEMLFYIVIGIVAAQGCMLYAFVMYYGRMRNILGWILRLLPVLIIAEDEISCFRIAMTSSHMKYLNSVVLQGVMLIVYLGIIIFTVIREKKTAMPMPANEI